MVSIKTFLFYFLKFVCIDMQINYLFNSDSNWLYYICIGVIFYPNEDGDVLDI